MKLTWQVGHVSITRILEQEFVMPAEQLLASYSADSLEQHRSWLAPDHLDDEASLRLAYQSFVIRSGAVRIVVDTCRGDDRPLPNGRGMVHTAFYDNLVEEIDPDYVDVVVCTHLHYDHVGWNVRLRDGEFRPTFPHARYLFGRTEFTHWTSSPTPNVNVDTKFGVDLVVRAGQHELVDPGYAITDEVSLVATPGHTPGHMSVRVRSDGAEAWLTGDVVHHPVQLAEPTWSSRADDSADAATTTRAAFAEHLIESGALVIGTHFAAPTAGYLRRTARHGLQFTPA